MSAPKKWRPFKQARAFVRALGLKGKKEWEAYSQSGRRPADIPSNPQKMYKDLWLGIGNWLGTGNVAPGLRKFRPFKEARAFVRSLGLSGHVEWVAYAKSSHRPADIPSNPQQVYRKEWRGVGDWLGTGNIAPKNCVFRSFEKARAFVQLLGLKTHADWLAYCKSGKRPADIPASPVTVYLKQWRGWGDWVGNTKKWLPFEQARAVVQSLGLKSRTDWHAYRKSGKRPTDIPSSPEVIYAKRWRGWGDWLGNTKKWLPFKEARAVAQSLGLKSHCEWTKLRPKDIPANPDRVYAKEWQGWIDFLGKHNRIKWRPFAEARARVHRLNLKTQAEWVSFMKSSRRLKDIPTKPETVYKEWTNWGDWLGNGNVHWSLHEWRPFKEARAFAQALNLNSIDAWNAYCKSGKKPDDIPSGPRTVYKQWRGWGDWLGTGRTNWNKKAVAAFIEDLRGKIHTLSSADLYTILQEAGLSKPLANLLNTSSMSETLKALRDDDVVKRIRSARVSDDNLNDGEEDTSAALDIEDGEQDPNEISLHAIDGMSVNPKTIERLIVSQIAGLRRVYVKDGEQAVRKLLAGKGGKHFRKLRRDFLEEIRGVESLRCPAWKLTVNGEKTTPNRMQRHTAIQVERHRKWANWSGVGAGKTASAGLAALHIKSKLTVVVANNSNVGQWKTELEKCFRGVRVYFDAASVKRGVGSFLVLNYEKFQTEGADTLADRILKLRPDFLVFDEVQLVKHRGESNDLSKRRAALLAMRQRLNGTRMLVMSATPVINELSEGASLLELLTAKPYAESTRGTISNALGLYYELTRHGLRFKPQYEQKLRIETIPTQQKGLVERLEGKQDMLDIEHALLLPKLKAAKTYIKPGTVIYTDFVDGLVPVIRRFVESLGLSCAEYTGDQNATDREHAKGLFISGHVDVLIGSRAAGLGVDGLQTRCHTLVMLSPPWTHAAFEQTIGRVYRQGSRFSTVRVVLPQVFINLNGERWSWDEARYALVMSKKKLSDCATDGVIPNAEEISKAEFTRDALAALDALKRRAA